MYSALSIASPILGDIVLDPHAIPFFAPKHHVGKTQVHLRLGVRGLEKSVFQGRLAQLVTGEWVGVIQKETCPTAGGASNDTFSLVLDNVTAPTFSGEPSEAQIEEFWTNLLVHKSNALPTFRDKFWRPFYDEEAFPNLGLRLRTDGKCHLLDLRQPTMQEDIHARHLLVDLGKDWLTTATTASLRSAFAIMRATEFATQVHTLTNDLTSLLHHTLKFYNLSEDERCLEVLKLSDDHRKAVEQRCRFKLTREMLPDGHLDGCTHVLFHPWFLARLWVTPPLKGSSRVDRLQWLLAYREQVCASYGSSHSIPSPPGRIGSYPSEAVRNWWATDFHVEVREPTAHDFGVALTED